MVCGGFSYLIKILSSSIHYGLSQNLAYFSILRSLNRLVVVTCHVSGSMSRHTLYGKRIDKAAYRDSAILDTIENLIADDPDLFEHGDINSITSVFVELVKKDFVLNICRIGAENPGAKNTVSLNMLYRIYKAGVQDGEIRPVSDLPELDEIVSPEEILLAKGFRDRYIAHLDFNRKLDRLEISDMRKVLEKYRKVYNLLALDGDDGMTMRLTKSVIEKIKMEYAISLGMLYSRLKRSEEEDY